MQNGMLPIALSQVQCKDLSTDAEEGMDLEIDLERQEIHRQDKPSIISPSTPSGDIVFSMALMIFL